MGILDISSGGITLAFTPILKIAIKLVINYLAAKYSYTYIRGGETFLLGNSRGTITSIGFQGNLLNVSYQ